MATDDLFQMEFGKMAGEEDEVIVTLPAPEGGATITKVGDATVVSTGGKAPAGGTADDAVDDLKGQFAAMTQRATNAERMAQEAADRERIANQRIHIAETSVVSSQLDTVMTGLQAAESEAAAAEREYTTAFEAGDGAAMARAQRAIAKSEARIQRLTEAKEDLEDTAERTKTRQPEQRQQPRQQPADPVERYLSQITISDKSAAWIRAHPEVVTDNKKNALMLAAHNMAVAEGIELESPEYFQRIEDGVSKGPAARKAAPDGRRPSSAAASGAGSGGALNGGTTVTLTKGEAQSATDGTLVWNYDDPTGQKRFVKGDPIGLAEMARRKHEGKKAGLYDKSLQE